MTTTTNPTQESDKETVPEQQLQTANAHLSIKNSLLALAAQFE